MCDRGVPSCDTGPLALIPCYHGDTVTIVMVLYQPVPGIAIGDGLRVNLPGTVILTTSRTNEVELTTYLIGNENRETHTITHSLTHTLTHSLTH